MVGHDVDLRLVSYVSPSHLPVFTYDLESVGNDADSHKLLSVVTAVHHQRVSETLDDGALRLSESLLGVSTGGVGDVDGSADLDVIAANLLALLALPQCAISSAASVWGSLRQGDITDFDIFVGPSEAE